MIKYFIVCVFIALFALVANASTYLDLDDEAYPLFARLEAEGVVRSGLLGTKPISRGEALRLLREAEANAAGYGEFIRALIGELRSRVGPEASGSGEPGPPRAALYGKYVYNTADARTLTFGPTREADQALNANSNGDELGRGSNERLGLRVALDDLFGFSFSAQPEFRTSGGDDGRTALVRGYIVYDFGWDLIAGRDAQWWGPGHRGALLLSNNAEPLTMAKVANPKPVELPWIFESLGPASFTFFVTRLERNRSDVGEPFFWGVRMVFKPHPSFELGLARTALLGGKGRHVNATTWWNSLIAKGENGSSSEPGDQRAGGDLKLTLPFSLQPVQVYAEADGEDGYHDVPSQWAYLYGLYLPRLLNAERVELRFEAATTHYGDAGGPVKDNWYRHHIYTSGYTYHGRIMGHFLGTDARDAYAELGLRIPGLEGRLALAFERVERGVSQPTRETNRELSLQWIAGIAHTLEISARIGGTVVHNAEFEQGATRRGGIAEAVITRRF